MERMSQISFDLIVPPRRRLRYHRGAQDQEKYTNTARLQHGEDPHDEPRAGEPRADAGCGRERDPGGRRDRSHVDKTIRHARDPVDRAKPTHLPGNALYLSWRRRLARRLIRATIPACRRYAKLNDRGSEEAMMANALSDMERALMDAYWRATNYLSVGQIYLYDNPLLKQSLTKDHIKPRLLGHWGTTPGLNFIYVHLNRVIKKHDLDMIYITGPGHGGPGLVANAYLEGTYSEVYPNISRGEEGMKRLFTQFSFPGGIPSHVAPETPGSIHEGGELGYAVSHAYGAAFDNPDLIVACDVGDGEAETGPLATSWHSNKFLNPARDGVVLPILHLNGYKIANPCILARISHEELDHLFRGYGYTPYFVEGHEPEKMHELMAETLDTVIGEI